jgi:hypothetical protein
MGHEADPDAARIKREGLWRVGAAAFRPPPRDAGGGGAAVSQIRRGAPPPADQGLRVNPVNHMLKSPGDGESP